MRKVALLVGFLFTFSSSIQSQSIISTTEKKADKLYAHSLYDRAVLEYHAVLGKNPENKRVMVKLARTYFKAGKFEEASFYYSDLSNSAHSASSADYLYYAIALNAVAQYESSEYWASRYLMIDPVNEQVQNLLFRLKARNSPEFSFDQLESDISTSERTSGTLLTVNTGTHIKSYVLTDSKVVEVMTTTPGQDIKWLEELLSDSNIIINKKISIDPILFNQGQSAIDEHHKSELSKLADLMKLYDQLGFEISGHTDTSASETNGQLLSQLRASAARDFLLARDIQNQRLLAIGNAANNPICEDQLESCIEQGLNRRLEFRLIYPNKNRMISTY